MNMHDRFIASHNNITAPHKNVAEFTVTLVAGGAVIGFDDEVHIDLDCAHKVLTPDEARQFAARLRKIAAAVDPFTGHKRGE